MNEGLTDFLSVSIVCVATFLGGTCIWFPETFGAASPRSEIAAAVKLADDGSLPPMSEKQLWSPEYWATVDKATAP